MLFEEGIAPDPSHSLIAREEASGLYRMALLYSEGNGVEKNMEKAKEYCKQVREDLTYSDTCVFEADWREEVELLLASFRIAE